MIKGIGVDICSIKRIDKILKEERSAFINNNFSSSEISESANHKNLPQFFASRFAAKEAFLKSLGIGIFNSKISLNEISIEKEENGKPFIKILNDDIRNEMDKIQIHLSISHEDDTSIAFVVLESI